jgi:hypothetical protein
MGGSVLKNDIFYRLDKGQHETTGEGACGTELHPRAAGVASGGRDSCSRLHFWGFPGGRGIVQPWRRRLWELQNNPDRE